MSQTAAVIPGLEFSELPDGTLQLSFQPVAGRARISAELLQAILGTSAYAAYRLDSARLARAVALYNDQDDPFVEQIGSKPVERMQLEINPDGMAAFLSILPVENLPPLSADDIRDYLQQHGATTGLMHDDIERIAHAAKPGDGFLVAQGTPPQTGDDGRLESLIEQLQQRHRKFGATDVVDFHELGNLVVVQPGDPLLRRIPPGAGTDGVTVAGAPVPAEPGQMALFPARLQGVEVAADNPDLLVAAIGGQPVLDANALIVEPVLTVKGVNLATGNVDFEGTVNVQGDVASGMSIKAGGDVIIGGTLEAASIDAGGNVKVSGGIKGHSEGRNPDRATQTEIRCKGTLQASFVENAHIVAGDAILIANVAMQSELEAGNQVLVGKPGSRSGHILGCKVRAMQLVQSGVIGSNTGMLTQVEVGTDPSEGRVLRGLQQTCVARRHALDELVKMKNFYLAHSEKASPELLQKVENTLRLRQAELAAAQEEADNQLARQKFMRSARIVAEKAMHGNVRLTIGSAIQEVSVDKLHPVVAQLDVERPRILFS